MPDRLWNLLRAFFLLPQQMAPSPVLCYGCYWCWLC